MLIDWEYHMWWERRVTYDLNMANKATWMCAHYVFIVGYGTDSCIIYPHHNNIHNSFINHLKRRENSNNKKLEREKSIAFLLLNCAGYFCIIHRRKTYF